MVNKKNRKKLPFDKYAFYNQAVQSPGEDVKFYQRVYKQVRNGKKAKTLREDFCAAGAICCEWAKMSPDNIAIGLDLDQEPMNYGLDNYVAALKPEQQSRVTLIQKNVLSPNLPKADITVAVNFSYFFFKQREMLKEYFANAYSALNDNGIFVIDIFGGTQCTGAIEDKTVHKNFTYYWDQKDFDPINNEAYFEIHFKYKGKKYEGVFNYDWRMWTIPEMRELMHEVGFKDSIVYWEGTNKKGEGNGIFKKMQVGEACESWIAYIAGVK